MKKKRKKNNLVNRPWWGLSTRCKISLGCLALLSVSLCLNPWMLDRIWYGFWWTVDYRLWPLWYFVELVVILILSLHWFRHYAAFQQGERREIRSVYLSGTVAAGMLLLTIFHRLSTFPL